MLWRRPRSPYEVTLYLNGRHPYLESNRLDYSSGEITIKVAARDFNEAERIGLRSKPADEQAWSWTVKAIRRLPMDCKIALESDEYDVR